MTDIITTPKKNVIIDATMFNTFMVCEQLLDLRFNHSFQSTRGKSNSLEIGSLAHKILEVHYLNIINGMSRKNAVGQGMTAGQMYITGCQECMNWTDGDDKPTCGHTPNEYPGLKNTPPDSQSKPKKVGYNWVMETMEEYFDFWKNDHWVPLKAEHVTGKVLYEDDEIRILWKAKIDVSVDTNQGIFPVDHKTMAQDRTSLDLNNQFIGQCLVTETRGMWINKIGWQTSKKPSEKFIRVPMNYSTARLLEWQSETLPRHVYNMLMCTESKYWPMRMTHCENKYGQCQFHDVCASDSNLREVELKTNFIVGEKWDPTNVMTSSE